jgi:transcriptional regulator
MDTVSARCVACDAFDGIIFEPFKLGDYEHSIMSSIELTLSQETILSALINLHSETETTVKGEDIAAEVDRNPGTIRNQMQSLKALQLVEGVPGPKGGYKPTASAYDALDVQQLEEAAEVPLFHNGEPVRDVNVEQISLSNVHHPDLCRAKIHIRGSVKSFHDGDQIRVGPTPLSNLVIEGELDSKDETNNILILTIDEMRTAAANPEH